MRCTPKNTRGAVHDRVRRGRMSTDSSGWLRGSDSLQLHRFRDCRGGDRSSDTTGIDIVSVATSWSGSRNTGCVFVVDDDSRLSAWRGAFWAVAGAGVDGDSSETNVERGIRYVTYLSVAFVLALLLSSPARALLCSVLFSTPAPVSADEGIPVLSLALTTEASWISKTGLSVVLSTILWVGNGHPTL